ncbi:MAG: DUF599 domain-containing protein [Burkholderiaceae bacterium]
MTPFDIIRLIPLADWAALGWFFTAWVTYALFAQRRAEVADSLLATTNHYRHLWMMRASARENRLVDSNVVQSFTATASFFASTTILIIGGLLALLGTTEKAVELTREIPFVARTSLFLFDLKVVTLAGVFVYAFFRDTWSMRQYTFAALVVASAPDNKAFDLDEPARQSFADRAGRMASLAAATFNDGLRAYYLSFAVILWFFSPWAFALGTFGVVYVLYQREFHSDVLAVLRD